ncbi:ribosome silencing factor [Evansella cellulosilytica]|uniref:Ribosomal silencing factor RsfS n=1 Tax=Evansella cellulosilytica (strain ATCC 21833 / DSM 2522 / FERM P-1141 / JCM 9156 / N-4) TaxID=649639 RepID=E6TW12_EVAC2|nr:ribosome silencing factor [Evansella cellulosilytica]ADU29835.1 iojap-like protein [Evansella cellulosilytica DSM 2522]
MDKKVLLDLAVRAADDKIAEDIVVLNMEGVSLITDYFVICHGNSEKQVEAIAREIKDRAQEKGIELKRLEGLQESRWVLIDLNEVIVHVFHKDERHYYNLEKLWGDAPTLTVEQVLNS